MTFWASLSDYLGFFLWIFILFTYLMAAFTVLRDIMHDKDLKGWARALWFVALVVVPFLSVLVYFIARGRGIAQRQQAAAQEAKMMTDNYIRTVAGNTPTDEIARAKNLLDAGTISAVEFDQLKARALGGTA